MIILRKSSTADNARQYATLLRTEALMEEILHELKAQTLGLELGTEHNLSREAIRR